MKKINRILALFLAMVLAIGVLPMSAFAADLQHTESTDSVATEEVQEETEAATESTEPAVKATTLETTLETTEATEAAVADTEATEVTEATEAAVSVETTAPTEATEISESTESLEPAQNEQPATIPVLAQKILNLPALQAAKEDTLWILGEYQINADPTLTFGNNWYDGITKMYFGSYSNPTYAYCIDPKIETHNNTDYSTKGAGNSSSAWNALGYAKQNAIILTLAYGFPSNYAKALPNSSDGWVQAAQYAATQVIVWEFTEGYRDANTFKRTNTRIVNSFSDSSNFMSAYNTIAGLLEKHGFTPSFTGPLASISPTIELKPDGKGNYVATVTDTNGVLADWTMPSISGVTFSKSGNALTIKATATAAKAMANGTVCTTTNSKMPSATPDAVLTWTSSSIYNTYQPVVSWFSGRPDPAPAFFKLHAQATGHAAVTKTSEDGKVSGISFQLKQGNMVLEEKKTDSNGKIIFTTDLLDGTKYTIHEVTPAGYVAQADNEITAMANQTVTLTFRNTLERGNLVVTKVSAKDGSPLPGISFRLTGTSTTGAAVNVVATTDANGEARFNDILVGDNFTLTEIQDSASAAWIVPDSITGIKITAGNTTANPVKVTVKNSDLTIRKVSEDGKVEGITFEITGGDLSGKLTVTTGANGEIHVGSQLHNGQTYTVHEVCPEAYVQPADQQITVKNDQVNELTFENKLKKWSAHVTKTDIETGTAQGDGTLAGAVYGVYHDGVLVDSYTTDEAGAFDTKTYICGEGWYIQEIKPSEGYKLNPGKIPVGAEAKNYTVEFNPLNFFVKEAAVKGKIAIIKTAGGNGQMVQEEGAVFQIWLSSAESYDSAREAERDTLTTNEAGFAQTKDLPFGTYTVHQVSGKYGHYLVEDFQVVISEAGKTYYYTPNNEQIRLKIKVVKVDAESGEKIPLAGFGFSFFDKEGTKLSWTNPYPTPTEVDTFYTGADGTLITPFDLPYSDYTALEVSTPEPYVRETEPIPFSINENTTVLDENGFKVVEIVVPNEIQKGRIKISKTGEGLVSVTKDGDLYTPVWGEVGIPGATYNVYAAVDYTSPDGVTHYHAGDLVDTVTTDAKGEATTDLLYLTQFIVKEDENGVPEGYLLDTEEHYVTLTYAGQEESVSIVALGVKDERQKAAISLVKALEQDTTYNLGMNGEIENVKFGLFAGEKITALDGSEIPAGGLIEIAGVQADGTLVFASDLPIGSYYVKEYAVDAQYLISEETYPITFTYEDDTTAVVRIEVNNGEAILNRIIRGSITGIKVDEQGDPLLGAVFGLFRADCTDFTKENALLTAESAEDGSFSFEDIPYGVWLVREVISPEGYVLSDEIFTVQISENGAVIELGNLENKPITGELELTKKDISDGKLLPGAGFRIKDADGNVVVEGYTDENGIAKFTLRYGKYTYEEFDAPEGYRIDTTPHEFEITEDGQIVKAEMTNEKIPMPDVPYTGDEGNLGFWIGLGSVALGGAIACALLLLRREKENE